MAVAARTGGDVAGAGTVRGEPGAAAEGGCGGASAREEDLDVAVVGLPAPDS